LEIGTTSETGRKSQSLRGSDNERQRRRQDKDTDEDRRLRMRRRLADKTLRHRERGRDSDHDRHRDRRRDRHRHRQRDKETPRQRLRDRDSKSTHILPVVFGRDIRGRGRRGRASGFCLLPRSPGESGAFQSQLRHISYLLRLVLRLLVLVLFGEQSARNVSTERASQAVAELTAGGRSAGCPDLLLLPGSSIPPPAGGSFPLAGCARGTPERKHQ
jgi:hypothetical protein